MKRVAALPEADMKSQNVSYIPAVDHLRGIAALLVVFYHGTQLIGHQLLGQPNIPLQRWHVTDNPFLSVILEGHTAVALFFVLSGFIFAFGNRDRRLQWVPFIRNRFLRIAPLMIALLMLGAAAFPDRFSLAGFTQHLMLSSNAKGASNFGPLTSMFWTISVEFQFYLIFPFLLYFAQKRGAAYLRQMIVLVVALKIVAGLTGGNIRDMTYWSLAGRLDQFFFGMLLGLSYRPGVVRLAIGRTVLLAISATVVMATLYFFHAKLGGWASETWLKLFWPTVEAACWALFVFAWLEWARGMNESISRLLCGLGAVSYSVYLLHFAVIDIILRKKLFIECDSVLQTAFATVAVYVVPATVGLSALTFRLIEEPFLELRVRYSPQPQKELQTEAIEEVPAEESAARQHAEPALT